MRCANCGGNHRAMDKKCVVFQESIEIKKVMAEQNVSGFEATRIVKGSYQKEDEIQEWKEHEDGGEKEERRGME